MHDVPTIIARTLKAKNAIKRTSINCLRSIPEGCEMKIIIGSPSTNDTLEENIDEAKLQIKNLQK